MMWGPVPVKHSNRNSQNPGQRPHSTPGWLRGWTLAIPSVGIALVAALLAVPRGTRPKTVPQPVIHRRALDATLSQLARRSEAARAQPLPFAVREVGEAYRRLGRTQYEGLTALDDSQALSWQRLIRSVRPKVGDDALQTLRAVQSDMFVTALDLWESTGKVSDELIELGGDFVRLARLNHWWVAGHLNISHDERWALALLRWTSLAGLVQREPYRLDRELEVVELRFFYSHPTPDGTELRTRQRLVARYSELDQDYPLDYSKGVLFAEAGQPDFAAASFMRHLQAHPQGQYAIRARNHLIWLTEQVRNLENDDAAR
jgi:hypothetical protein